MENKSLLSECNIAKEALCNHGVIAFPTETVMGLAVFFDDFEAYNKMNAIKRRPEDKPYTLMLGDVKDIEKYAYVSNNVKKIIDAFMPGSLTILVPAKDSVPNFVTHNTQVVGLRVPTNIEALTLLKIIKKPILAPSANKSGERPALNSKEAYDIFRDELDAYISGSSKGERPSTIVNLCGDKPVVVRPGPINEEEILKAWNE